MSSVTTLGSLDCGVVDCHEADRPLLHHGLSRLSTASAMREFDDFYAEHRDEIGRALVFVLRDRTLGEEAVDEAMAKAFQKWDEIGQTHNPAGWVFIVGKRWGLSWRRSRRRERNREELVTARDTEFVDQPSADYLDLMTALDGLSADQRTVVACRFSLGMSTAETADLLGIREGTVKSRLSRSIDRLRVLLTEDEQ